MGRSLSALAIARAIGVEMARIRSMASLELKDDAMVAALAESPCAFSVIIL